jgi:hypothetical protein
VDREKVEGMIETGRVSLLREAAKRDHEYAKLWHTLRQQLGREPTAEDVPIAIECAMDDEMEQERARLADVLGRELTDEEFRSYHRGQSEECYRASESAGK